MKLTTAQRYALAYYAAQEDGTPLPSKRWDAKQSPRWDVVERLRGWGLIDECILRLTPAGRQELADTVGTRTATGKAMDTTLTQPQARALFTLGAYGTTMKYGTWGKRQTAMLIKLRGLSYDKRGAHLPELVAINPTASARLYVLTAEGQQVFDALFTKCPEHGWEAPTFPTAANPDRAAMVACPHCRALCKAVHGHE